MSFATNAAVETGGKFTASVTAINVYSIVNLGKDVTINVVTPPVQLSPVVNNAGDAS
jgi:hypothetical protein